MTPETDTLIEIIRHISDVQANISEFNSDLTKRGILHDRTKLDEFEFTSFVKTRPKFKQAEYGSKLYSECMEEIKPAIEHHYKNNRHHTAYHGKGFGDMNLLDILEMLAGWKAANERNKKLSFKDSLSIAYEKYKIPINMQKHIDSTLKYLGWIDN